MAGAAGAAGGLLGGRGQLAGAAGATCGQIAGAPGAAGASPSCVAHWAHVLTMIEVCSYCAEEAGYIPNNLVVSLVGLNFVYIII